MKIYTKTGDTGTTSLVGGIRIGKDDARLEAYGTIDELNSHIGLLAAMTDYGKSVCTNQASDTVTYDSNELQWIQNALFAIGSFLATDLSQTKVRQESLITECMVSRLEQSIDRLGAELPPLKSFVLPGGTVTAAQCNVCRTVCRRAERNIISMIKSSSSEMCQYANLLKFINRLSDYFFVLSRKINNNAGVNEFFWQNVCGIK